MIKDLGHKCAKVSGFLWDGLGHRRRKRGAEARSRREGNGWGAGWWRTVQLRWMGKEEEEEEEEWGDPQAKAKNRK